MKNNNTILKIALFKYYGDYIIAYNSKCLKMCFESIEFINYVYIKLKGNCIC